jgi:hypothetical protein
MPVALPYLTPVRIDCVRQEHGNGETVVHLLAGMPWHNAILVFRIFKKKELRSVALKLKSDTCPLIAGQ